MGALISWYWYAVKYTAKELWAALPGPWPVKLALIIGCQLIPGPADEIALIALTALIRRRARKNRFG